jgi:hypothetical protein
VTSMLKAIAQTTLETGRFILTPSTRYATAQCRARPR